MITKTTLWLDLRMLMVEKVIYWAFLMTPKQHPDAQKLARALYSYTKETP